MIWIILIFAHMKSIEVVAAIIRKDDKIFATQREHVDYVFRQLLLMLSGAKILLLSDFDRFLAKNLDVSEIVPIFAA